MESEIRKVDLRQNQDQSEQEQLEYQQGPTPALHNGGNLPHAARAVNNLFTVVVPRDFHAISLRHRLR
jgi:hypothetical protein